MISKKQIITGINLFFTALALIAWPIALVLGICLVAEVIVLALNTLGLDISKVAAGFVISILISIVSIVLSILSENIDNA